MRRKGALKRFLESPTSVRNTIRVLVVATVLTTIGGGIAMWVFDRDDFSSMGDAMWWSLQTVTTVGYGDVTPKTTTGRYIGAAFLVYSVAFLSILTAAVTATFVEHARRFRRGVDPTEVVITNKLDEIAERLGRLERRLADDARESPEH